MLSVQFFVLGTADMGRAIDFWTQALGYVVSEGGAEARWTELMPADGPGAALALQYSETPGAGASADPSRPVRRRRRRAGGRGRSPGIAGRQAG